MADEDRPITSSGNNTNIKIELPRETTPVAGNFTVNAHDPTNKPYTMLVITGIELKDQGDGSFKGEITKSTAFSVTIT